MRISGMTRTAVVGAVVASMIGVAGTAAHAARRPAYRTGGTLNGEIVEAGTGLGVESYVHLINRATGRTRQVQTDTIGDFTKSGLPTGDYFVCATGIGSGAPYGYVSRCHGSPQWWLGAGATSHAIAVHVDSGTTSTAGVALHDGGAISGVLRDRATGHRLDFSDVTLFQHGRRVLGTTTDSPGDYEFDGLPAVTGRNGFQVCFWIGQDYDVPQQNGWAPQCWHAQPWSRVAGYPPAAGSVRVDVTEGAATSGINALMRRGAAIAGVIRSAGAGHPALNAVTVVAYKQGLELTSPAGWTYPSGHYLLHSLPPGRYVVCASGGTLSSAPHARFGARCWRNVVWNRRTAPSAPTVTGSDGTVHRGINLYLPQVPRRRGTVHGAINLYVPRL